MITPIVLISSFFLFPNLHNDSKTEIQRLDELPRVQIPDRSKPDQDRTARSMDPFQATPEYDADRPVETKKTKVAGSPKNETVYPTAMKSESPDTLLPHRDAQKFQNPENKSGQRILRVGFDFFKAMGVEVSADSYSVFTKDTTVSLQEHGSVLAWHVFKKSGVTSYDNWTDTVWPAGEEIPSLVAITNGLGKLSFSFSGDRVAPNVLKGEISLSTIEMCVAVTLDSKDSTSPLFGPVFWFLPNEKFFNNLPDEIAEPLKQEFDYHAHDFLIWTEHMAMLKSTSKSKDDSMINPKKPLEPVPCVYFTNLCESLPGLDYVNLYPNPATDKLTIDLVLQKAKKIQFRVFDLGGRLISDEESPENYPDGGQFKHQVDVSRLQPGLYLLVMTDNEGAKVTRRFVKN